MDSISNHATGQRRDIPHLWAFMLLGQIVAISFAANLFFAAVLLGKLEHRQVPAQALPSWSWHLAVIGTLASVAAIPHTRELDSFIYILLAPHLLLFLPIIARPPSTVQTLGLQVLTISTGLILMALTTIDVGRVGDSSKLNRWTPKLTAS